MNRRRFFQTTIGCIGAVVLPNIETLPTPVLPPNKLQNMVTNLKPFPPVEIYISPGTLEDLNRLYS